MLKLAWNKSLIVGRVEGQLFQSGASQRLCCQFTILRFLGKSKGLMYLINPGGCTFRHITTRQDQNTLSKHFPYPTEPCAKRASQHHTAPYRHDPTLHLQHRLPSESWTGLCISTWCLSMDGWHSTTNIQKTSPAISYCNLIMSTNN